VNRLELQEISREKPRAEDDLACPARFERATYALEGRCFQMVVNE